MIQRKQSVCTMVLSNLITKVKGVSRAWVLTMPRGTACCRGLINDPLSWDMPAESPQYHNIRYVTCAREFLVFSVFRAFPSAHVNSSKIEKCANFTHFEQKKIPTSVGVKLCIIYTRLCKWTVTVYIFTVTVHRVNHFFILFSLSSIKLLLFPNHYNNLVRQNQLKINQTHLLKINQNQPSINWKLTQNQQKINPNTSTQTNLHRDTLVKKKNKK